ncbi:MAG: class I SAM-dependent methyltransferase [Fuerstiella sp.]
MTGRSDPGLSGIIIKKGSFPLIKSLARALLPAAVHESAARRWQQIRHFGRRHYCPLCRSHVASFLPHGTPVREQALCPVCRCKEAHRLAYLYLSERTDILKTNCTMLHIAPEPELSRWLRRQPRVIYLSGDLCPGVGELCLNLCRLPFRDSSLDLVYCAHVLNALPDDMQAMREVHRVLKPGGVAVMNVPLQPGAATLEPEEDSAAGRMRLCHDPDIYRIYGDDLPERFADVDLQIELEDFYSALSMEECRRCGLQATPVARCTKPR